MKILKEVLRKNRTAILLYAAVNLVNTAVFALYGMLTEALIYAVILTFVLLLTVLAVSYVREKRKSEERVRALASIHSAWQKLPEADTLAEKDYQIMIAALGEQIENLTAKAGEERQDMLDYYTSWVHQIKTPIAVMRLKLSDDTPEHRGLSVELSRIEQYADMALQYIRVSGKTNDLVIREYRLDDLIRDTVRKLAPQFVEKRLRLLFESTEQTIITDQKWFCCILEQLLTNAVKYTPSGTVRIRMEGGKLMISDTGIGIMPEDLPRIFEMGFTGVNGRLGQKSSGLGLYLAKKAADLLAIPLLAESVVNEGSIFTLDLRQNEFPARV